ncbi:MAG: cryptochrome/photolyase family protein [Actinomycetota bacterium]
MRTTVVLFTRDLRVHDHPALHEAQLRGGRVVPAFVLDDAILGSRYGRPNRVSFLIDSLKDLDASLKARGARLVIRRGDVVAEAMVIADDAGADALFMSADYSKYARMREERLGSACKGRGIEFRTFDGVSVVAPGDVTPANGDHFKVFTPYFNKWKAVARRSVHEAPRSLDWPSSMKVGRIPAPHALVSGSPSPEIPTGGETAGRERLDNWLRVRLAIYGTGHDDLASDDTSRLSPYLHFGCISPRYVEQRVRGAEGGEDFIRQICWRDFYNQVLAVTPDYPRKDYRSHGDSRKKDRDVLGAWIQGRTGYPIVDAGMRQLQREGFMHNRARLITASFLTKTCYIDWTWGAWHFFDLLVDGDMANNSGNWQWVAGTGNDTRPNRVLNPIRQGERYDPSGDYVRRYVEELAGVEGKRVHQPWKLDDDERKKLDYPDRIVDHEEGMRAYRARRGRS